MSILYSPEETQCIFLFSYEKSSISRIRKLSEDHAGKVSNLICLSRERICSGLYHTCVLDTESSKWGSKWDIRIRRNKFSRITSRWYKESSITCKIPSCRDIQISKSITIGDVHSWAWGNIPFNQCTIRCILRTPDSRRQYNLSIKWNTDSVRERSLGRCVDELIWE